MKKIILIKQFKKKKTKEIVIKMLPWGSLLLKSENIEKGLWVAL